ncbi:hypothetical protein F444_10426 [Phytophthora nicotianae P1976]|uniref:Uncharacterized protein n=1 Tax=Phytophthora nicotianae P1976 TaxID=1317066 RepID=A0A081A447_PHYNI|nr:hypothetical protein F444_10426 [Phytophthora nicotianae P1976]
MRFVLFSSCGNLDFYRIIPPENTFGLDSKPGLHLTRVELDEMVHSSCVAIVCDPVWIMCLQHIGIARSMLTFLSLKFRSMRVGMISAGDMEMELRSPGLLEYSGASYRGIATPDALERVKQAHDLSAESYRKIGTIEQVWFPIRGPDETTPVPIKRASKDLVAIYPNAPNGLPLHGIRYLEWHRVIARLSK